MMDKPTITFGSLFSGIGGLDLGLKRAGLRCAWQVEIDLYATCVLEKQFPDVARFRDVRSIGRHKGDIHTCYFPVSDIDALVGGFPCQPQSLAGKRKASKDARNLWPEFCRLICELEPRWIVAENVLGLLSSENGAFFGGILRDLAACGYDARWQVLSAAQFGAPHLRERVILVGHANSDRQWIGQDQQERQPASVGPSDACVDGAQEYVAYTQSQGRSARGARGWQASACQPIHLQSTNNGDDRVCADQSPELVESSTSSGCQEWQDTARAYNQSHASGPLAHASSAGWEEFDVAAIAGEQGHHSWRTRAPGSKGMAQSLLGRIFDGISRKLDGYRWPALPGQDQYDWEAPRVLSRKIPYRGARLKGLGNAVVVALAEYVGRCIMAAEAEREVVA